MYVEVLGVGFRVDMHLETMTSGCGLLEKKPQTFEASERSEALDPIEHKTQSSYTFTGVVAQKPKVGT